LAAVAAAATPPAVLKTITAARATNTTARVTHAPCAVGRHDKRGDGRADCSEFTKEFYVSGRRARGRRERVLQCERARIDKEQSRREAKQER
jgi:hypothetical protein